VETGGRADHVGVLLQLSAVGELRVLQVLDGGELAVDEAGVGQRPQMLGAVGCSGASAALPSPTGGGVESGALHVACGLLLVVCCFIRRGGCVGTLVGHRVPS
jgi:hypothetical protein